MTTTAASRTKQSRPSRSFTLVPELTRTKAAVTDTSISHVGWLGMRVGVCVCVRQMDRTVPVCGSSIMASVLL